MARADYKAYRSGIRELLASPAVRRDLNRRAQSVLAAARSAAPYGEDRGGHIRDSLEVVNDSLRGSGRARVRVVAQKRYASVIDTAWLARSLDAGRGGR